MTDVAQILGVGTSSSSNKRPRPNSAAPSNAAASEPPPPLPASHQPSRAMKLQGMPREVMHLLGDDAAADFRSAALPPAVPAASVAVAAVDTADSTKGQQQQAMVKVGNKWISSNKPARRWTWAPFSSSSRTDGALFYHWVRAGVEYPDYPYARFDIHMDPVTYSSEEYERYLQSDAWTKSETDQLLDLCRRFELRWPIIHDRWIELFGQYDGGAGDSANNNNPKQQRNVEDLQNRYYSVAAKLTQSRISQEAATEVQTLVSSTPATATAENPKAAAEALLMETAAARALASSEPSHQPLIQNVGAGVSNKTFDYEYERERRAHMQALWDRSKQEEVEEAELRKELKQVEAQLRKLKKSGGHILAAAAAASGGSASVPTSRMTSAASSRNPSRSVSPVAAAAAAADNNTALQQAFLSTAPTPMPQFPYLQSGRLVPPATGGSVGLNKSLLARMDAVLDELQVPDNPLPTKRVCDLYDVVRKDVLTLLILQKNVMQKEGMLQSKRLKLAKMGGNIRVVDEETLLGIAPPAPSPSRAAGKSKGGGGSGKAKAGAGGGGKTKSGGGGGKSKAAAASKAAKPEEAGATATSTSGKATSTSVKEAPAGGKQPRKGGTKRKRKSESSSSKPPAPSATSASAATAKSEEGGAGGGTKQAGKKRARKSA